MTGYSLISELATWLALVTGYGRSDCTSSKSRPYETFSLGTFTLSYEQAWVSLEQRQVSRVVPGKAVDM